MSREKGTEALLLSHSLISANVGYTMWQGCHTLPTLALHFKAALKTGSGCCVCVTRAFLANSKYILRFSF